MEEGEAVHRKLEGFADQYCTLLKNQLEHQRVYYGEVLEGIRRGEVGVEDGGERRHGRRGGVSSTVVGRRKKGATLRRAIGGSNNYTTSDAPSTANIMIADDHIVMRI